jgi:hypothetical protein
MEVEEEEMEGDVVEGEEEEGEDPFEQDMKREAEQRMLQAERVRTLLEIVRHFVAMFWPQRGPQPFYSHKQILSLSLFRELKNAVVNQFFHRCHL